ncbi:MAG: hypothetical protein J5449_08285 [Oscillospiraceae bacterium]|nr:hypothetical protein [Oscillospiraceae bacterium]
MFKSKALRALAAVLAVIMLCLSLSACRESPVLHEIIYEYSAPIVDEEEQMLAPEDDGEEDEQFENEERDDTETERDVEDNISIEDPNDPEPTENGSVDVNQNENSENDWQSQDKPTEPSQNEDTEGGTEKENETEEGSGGEGEGEGETPEEIPGDPQSLRQIVDATGELVDIPEQVDTVTANRWAAQMVEIVGGAGRLVGTNSSLLNSSLAWAAFSDLGSVESMWSGSGSWLISDDSFAKLLELKPQVCFTISGDYNFTDDQLEQLQKAGVYRVVLPSLRSADALCQAVNIVASVMGTSSTGADSASIAAAYSTWVDKVYSDVSGTVPDDCTSLYIADWDSGASYVLNNTKGVIEPEGSGLAMAYSPIKNQLISTFMRAAGIVNESTRIMSSHTASSYVYVAPMFHQFDPAVSENSATYYSGAGEYGSAFDLFVARMITDTLYYQLGSTSFPAIVVADSSIKYEIENNWFWQYHATDGNGYIDVEGEQFYCGVIGEYSIYVNPYGMCSWADGSVESPLEAYWLSSKFGTTYTLDDVKTFTNDFYQQFFGVSLSDGQLADIFGG